MGDLGVADLALNPLEEPKKCRIHIHGNEWESLCRSDPWEETQSLPPLCNGRVLTARSWGYATPTERVLAGCTWHICQS